MKQPDRNLSKLLYANGLFTSRDSRIVYDIEMQPHLELHGSDMAKQRGRIFMRAGGKCKRCHAMLSSDWEMDHIESKGMGGTDDMSNLQALCGPCHVKKHNRYPKFGAGRAEAIEEFNTLNGVKRG